jgi:hypothetical protein
MLTMHGMKSAGSFKTWLPVLLLLSTAAAFAAEPTPAAKVRKTSGKGLTCWTTPGYFIKLHEPDEEGSGYLGVIPLPEKAKAKACKTQKDPAEKRLTDGCEQFAELGGDHLVTTSCESFAGISKVTVWSLKTAKAVFQDDYADGKVTLTAQGPKLSVRYRRAQKGSCSVYQQKEVCLQKLFKEAGLPANTQSDCLEKKEEDFPESETILSYEVELEDLLTPAKKPVPNTQARCWQSNE